MRVISFVASSDSSLGVLADSWHPDSTTSVDLLFEEDSRFRVDTMFVSDSTRSIYDQVLGLDVGQTVGPRPYRGGFILLAVDGIEAPREKTFEEARADVVSEYQTAVEQAWLKRLHDRYDAEIYAENLVSAFEGEDGSSETSPASDGAN
jgi:peptidyl-prolyl cis-trans isomerase SurA